MDEFIAFIKRYIELSAEAESALRDTAVELQIEKGIQLIEEGNIARKLYFLKEGTARNYCYFKGKDITNWIYSKNNVFTSWASFLSQVPATEYTEIIQDAHCVVMRFSQWEDCYQKFPELERFGRLLLSEQIALIDQFYRGYYFLSAKEKYELLLSYYPDVLQHANLGYIASLLGISQETLSRVRGK